jgi:hypothetical protein
MITSMTNCSGKHIRNRSNSFILAMTSQQCKLNLPLELLMLAIRLGHTVGFSNRPFPGFIAVGSAFLGAGSLSSSTLIPWRQRSLTSTPPSPTLGERIDFSGHSSSRLLITRTMGSAILLTHKWHCGGHSHQEVELHNVEHTSIIDFGNAHDVTPLLLPVDNPLALANDKHIRELTLIVVRPFHSNSLARVEELSLASAKGTNAGGEGLADHGGNVTIADSLVWYLQIPTVEMAASPKTIP